MKTFFTILAYCFTAGIAFSQGLSLPYTSGFDSPAKQAGWQLYRTGNDPGASQWNYSGGGFSAPNSLSHDYNVGGSTTDTVIDWFVSPALNFTSPGQLSLKVQIGGFSTPFPDSFEIWFGTNDPSPVTGNFTLVANLSYMAPQYQWLDTTVNIPFSTDSGYIALKYKTIGAAWSTYAVDNIAVSLDTNLSISESSMPGIAAFHVFPNPSAGRTTVLISDAVSLSSAEIRIYDSVGRMIRSITGITNKEVQIAREGLESGIYFIYTVQENKIKSSKRLIICD